MARYSNPSAVVLACQNVANYSYSAELECLSLNGAPKFPELNDGTWELGASGVKLREGVYNLFSNPQTRVIDAVEFNGEYENCIFTPAGLKQLIITGGYAEPIEP